MKRRNYHQIYFHLVWATYERMPLITPDLETQLYQALAEKCRLLNCIAKAIGGTENHVHVLVKGIPLVSVTKLVKEIKGYSSFLVSKEIDPGRQFKWQEGYGAFTVGHREVPKITRYILNQKQHHAKGDLFDEWGLFD